MTFDELLNQEQISSIYDHQDFWLPLRKEQWDQAMEAVQAASIS